VRFHCFQRECKLDFSIDFRCFTPTGAALAPKRLFCARLAGASCQSAGLGGKSLLLEPSNNSARNGQALVGRGRYRLEAELGHGGVASVYRAFDLSHERPCALKRLKAAPSGYIVSLFEREYHTLASLVHPNIIEVYDYGTDEIGPYYVMELLEGADLSEHSRTSWREVAEYGIGIASALSMLHARRLIHRDVSARNVWRLPSGQIKLIDFGALTGFGSHGHIVGTPPHVAPEAIYGRPLDQRTDLYGLGALLYLLLAAAHAYPARSLRELPALWLRPALSVRGQLAQFGPEAEQELPPELDALVMSMLSDNAMARPSSAGEVIDRLSALLGRERRAETIHEIALEHPELVGRARERALLRAQLSGLHEGRGGALLFGGCRGLGRSRLLLELAADARVSGIVVLHVEAKRVSGAHGVVEALTLRLLDALPELAEPALRAHANKLGRMLVRLPERIAGAHPSAATPGVEARPLAREQNQEARAQLHEALHEVFESVARQLPMLLSVDDLERADEGSIAWLAGLAERLPDVPIVLSLGVLEAPAESEGFALKALRQHGRSVPLKALGVHDTHRLLASLFGEVPHLLRLSERVQRSTQGLPGRVVELARRLVSAGAIANLDGTWVLPQDIPAEQLLVARDEAAPATLARLSPAAHSLAKLVSLQRGLIPLEMCRVVSPLPAKELFAALEELVREGVLTSARGGYLFADPGFVSTLAGALEKEEARETHRRIGELLLQRGPGTSAQEIEALVHVMEGGDLVEAPARITRLAVGLRNQDIEEVITAAPALERALTLFRDLGKRDADLIALLGALSAAGFFSDRGLLQRHGDAALEATSRTLGIDFALKLAPWLGRHVALIMGLAIGALRTLRQQSWAPTFRERMEIFFETLSAFAAASVICADPAGVTRAVSLTAPFAVLGIKNVAGFAHEFLVALLTQLKDRPAEARRRWKKLISLLESKEALPDMAAQIRLRYLGGSLYGLGVMEAWREDSEALRIADRLTSFEIKMYEMMADQVRTVYHAHQGDRALYNHYRQRAELHAIQRGTAWQVETWAPAAAIASALRSSDAMALKEAHEQLRRLEEGTPSLGLLRRRARAGYLYLRKRYQEARVAYEECAQEKPGEIVAWAGIQGSRAACLNRLGDHALAKRIIEETRAQMDPADFEFAAINLGLTLEHARAEAGLGHLEVAARELEERLTQPAPEGGKLTMGALHEARAEVARLAEAEATWKHHIERMEHYFLDTNIPSLVARCAAQRRELMQTLGLESCGTTDTMMLSDRTEYSLTETKGSLQTGAQLALHKLAGVAGAKHGALFVLQEGCVLLAATRGSVDVPDELAGWVEERLSQADADLVTRTELFAKTNAADPDAFERNAARFRLHVLSAPIEGDMKIAGAIVLEEPKGTRYEIAPPMLQMAAEQLLAKQPPETRTAQPWFE
jgi:tetratricopeptide (TPR) repeat protein